MKFILSSILAIALSCSALAASYVSNTHIYNNSLSSAQSTVAILGEPSTSFLMNPKIDPSVKYIFVIINGQQFPCKPSCLGEKSEKIFGRALTGASRVKEGRSWKGKYQIYSGADEKNRSMAVNIYKTYGKSAIVVDILNAKYNWAYSEKKKRTVQNYVSDIILKLSKAVKEVTNEKPAIAFVGFSRGAVLSYVLAMELSKEINLKAVFTIDPVINKTLEKHLIKKTSYYNYKSRKWQNKKPMFPVIKKYYDFYPVLDTSRIERKTSIYNVFQRRAMSQFSNFSKPVGSAMDRAYSPCLDKYDPCDSYMRDNPVDQLDISMSSHAPNMVDRYGRWIMDTIINKFSVPRPVMPEPPKVYVAPQFTSFSVYGYRYYVGRSTLVRWRGNKKNMQYSTSFSKHGDAKKWSNWQGNYFGERFTAMAPGKYIFKVKVKDEKNEVVISKYIFVKPIPPAINFKSINPQVTFVGEEINVKWETDHPDNVFSYHLQGPKGVLVKESKYKKDKMFLWVTGEMGEYRLTIRAKGRFSATNVRTMVFNVHDYLFEDEGISCGWCGVEHSCSFTVAKIIKMPEETDNRGYVVLPTNNAALWDMNTNMETHFTVKKSFPVTSLTKSKLKVGQSIFWNSGNQEKPIDQDMRKKYVLGKIVSLDKVEQGVVTVRSYRGFATHTKNNKEVEVYRHSLRTFDENLLKGYAGSVKYCNARYGLPGFKLEQLALKTEHNWKISELNVGAIGYFSWREPANDYMYNYSFLKHDVSNEKAVWSGWTLEDGLIKKSFDTPGKYKLLIKSKNRFGAISKTIEELLFKVVKKEK